MITQYVSRDADIEFDVDSILRALAYDKDIMAAAYPKKALPIQYAINFKFLDPATKKKIEKIIKEN